MKYSSAAVSHRREHMPMESHAPDLHSSVWEAVMLLWRAPSVLPQYLYDYPPWCIPYNRTCLHLQETKGINSPCRSEEDSPIRKNGPAKISIDHTYSENRHTQARTQAHGKPCPSSPCYAQPWLRLKEERFICCTRCNRQCGRPSCCCGGLQG
ncbi:uncharacterized protein [Triticum aestivum]|uniref:uncharacterized protein n=1 Tax=Triticum aestivum TaxID=4565 RepID=UPI001D01AE62|nr:uncharacterized protein LOC123058001 [Triticum aestivum]